MSLYTQSRQIRQWHFAIALSMLIPLGCIGLFWGPRIIALHTAPLGTAGDIDQFVNQIKLSNPAAVIPPNATEIRFRNANLHGGVVEVEFQVSVREFDGWIVKQRYSTTEYQYVRVIDVGDGRVEASCPDCRSLRIPDAAIASVHIGQTKSLQAEIAYSPITETGYLVITTAGGW